MAVLLDSNTGTWAKLLAEVKNSDSFRKAYSASIADRKAGKIIYPKQEDVFNALVYTPFDRVSVVILGQDPYHGPGQAEGLSFSVPRGVPIPPSLQNIFKEIHTDIGLPIPKIGHLESWARQGVLLLNTVLTVEQGRPASHAGRGWEQFTDTIISKISEHKNNVVFLLWGRHAQAKASLIDSTRHTVLTAAHPSPLSAYNGFFGCKHFSKTNAALVLAGKQPIDWGIPE